MGSDAPPDVVPGAPPDGARRRAALAGVLAAGLTLGVAHLVAAWTGPGTTPLVAVGEAFIDVTPPWLKDFAVAVFGVHDKTALLVGMGLVLTALATGAGVLSTRSRPAGTAVVLALGALGAAAAASRPDGGYLAVVPSIAGAVAGALVLRFLVDRSTRSHGAPGPQDAGRRAFLGAAVLVSAAALVAAAVGSLASVAGTAASSAREALRLPAPARPARPVPAGAQSPVPGVVDVVTPNDEFYRIDTALTVPRVDPANWSLRVHGLVDQEVRITFDDLVASELVEAYVTLACVSNPIGGDLVGNARWLGLPIRELLARAGPLPGADMVLSTSIDGFTASTPLEVLTDERDALLAIGMNGEPLPAQHGFPVRMVVPGLYGYVSATKWVADLEVTRFADQDAYWTVRGWSPRGPIKTASRIEVPRRGSVVAAGTVAVGGTAWAQHTGITRVEVQVDDEPWQEATLADEISVDTWRQWSWHWAAEAGPHTLRVRATDSTGETQTPVVTSVAPDGATGWHEVRVRVEPA